jgi:hypothetical protein
VPLQGHFSEAGPAVLRLWEPPDEINRRLRPEKSQMVARTRGFNSRRLQERSAFALSVVGGGKSPFVAPDDLPGPQQGILRSDARGLRTNPYLEVLEPVVVPDSIGDDGRSHQKTRAARGVPR